MRTLIVYESMFGNTRQVASAIGDGLRAELPDAEVEVVEVGEAPSTLPADLALLVVGGPTHAHGMTSAMTRAGAADRDPDGIVSRGIGVREWLEGLERPRQETVTAAFDTRVKGPGFLTGSAARGAEKRLRAAGYHVAAVASFLVNASGPPTSLLVEGELERARHWGASLAASIPAVVA
jgi:hypothetical protein